jgi:MinD superfamily P-loop ATPase
MKLAVASGKGGTGKTTVAVNLALVAGRPVLLADCDVEEPNDHLFFAGLDWQQRIVTSPVPAVDESRCDGCGLCSRFCQYNAIVSFGVAPYVSPELCHGCGGCSLVCPHQAITEVQRRIGVVEMSRAGAVALVQGRLDVGSALAPPLIRAVKRETAGTEFAILDAPPGTSCPVISALRGVDYALLVTEPTPFGLNDLELAVGAVRELGLPHGVVINRADIGDDRVNAYCRKSGIAVLAEIPDDRRIAEAYSRGEPLIAALPEYRGIFERILDRVRA